METILVVCGAGASSTFLASRMRKLATGRDLDLTARAASTLDLDSRLADAGVLLVGPHLEPEFAELQAAAALHGVEAALLPPTAFGPDGAANALEMALALLAKPAPAAVSPSPSTSTEGSTHA
jgi:cellobiose PTS system EIIB component